MPIGPTAARSCRPRSSPSLDKFYRYVDRDDDAITYRTLPGVNPKGRLFHPRLGPQPVRWLHRGLHGIPGSARSAEAQVLDCRALHAEARVIGKGDSKIGIVSIGSCDGAVREAMDVLARQKIPLITCV
jgi:2-oxoglutarate ferredoxin oxidoreductase subunit alpha